MRSEFGIIKIFCEGFHLTIFPCKKLNKKYWGARISNKRKRVVKEFIDPNKAFVKLKAIEWIKSRDQIQ